MSNGMVIEWEGRLYEATGLDYPCMDSVLAYNNGKPVVKRMREDQNRFLILRPIKGPTRAELAEALAAADACLEEGDTCVHCSHEMCQHNIQEVLRACRAAGLLPNTPDHAKATE